MGWNDFDWAKKGYRWLDNVLADGLGAVDDALINTPSWVKNNVLKPTVRSAGQLSRDAGAIFTALGSDAYENLFDKEEYMKKVKRNNFLENALGVDIFEQTMTFQGTSDTGTGWLPGGEALARAEEKIQENRARVGSHAFTFGRAAAYPLTKTKVVSEDGLIYNLVSGTIDFMGAIKNPIDPFNYINAIKPGGTMRSSRVATGGTRVADKQNWVSWFDEFENKVLEIREDVRTTGRKVNPDEMNLLQEYTDLTSDLSPTVDRYVNSPIGEQVAARGFEAGRVYDYWAPKVDDRLRNVGNAAGLVDDVAPSLIRNNYQLWRNTADATNWATDLLNNVRNGNLNAAQIWKGPLNREGIQTANALYEALSKPEATLDDVWRIIDQGVASFEPGFNLRNIGRSRVDAIRSGQGYIVKNAAQKLGIRSAEMLPEDTKIGFFDPEQSARNIDNLMGSFGFDSTMRDQWLSRFAKAVSGTKDQMFTFMREFEREGIKSTLRAAGFGNDDVFGNAVIEEISSYTQRSADQVRLFTTDDMGRNVPLEWIDGDGVAPLRLTQMMSDAYYIIPPQLVSEIIRRTGGIREFAANVKSVTDAQGMLPRVAGEAENAARLGVGAALKVTDPVGDIVRHYMTQYWKPSRVAKISHLIRVVPEEVLRGMASGIYEHPMEQVMAMLGRRLTKDVDGNVIRGKVPNTVKLNTKVSELEVVLAEARMYENNLKFGNTLTRAQQALVDKIPKLTKQIDDLNARINTEQVDIFNSLIGPRTRGALASATGEYAPLYSRMVRQGVMQIVDRTITSQRNAWARGVTHELVDMAYNEDYRRIAAGALFDEDTITIKGFTDTIGNHIDNGAVHPYTGAPLANDLDAVKLWLLDGSGRQYFQGYFDNIANLKPNYTGDGWDTYTTASERVETILNHDIASVTGLDPTLLEVISTGKFNDVRAVMKNITGRGEVSPDLGRYITDTFIDLPHAPQYSKNWVQNFLAGEDVGKEIKAPFGKALNRLYRFYFEEAYGRASDFFARSPVWKAAYWTRMEELVSLMSPDEAANALSAAKAAKLTPTRIERIALQARLANGAGKVEDAKILAAGYATRYTNDLLFNANKRSVFAEQHKILSPFFEAWREVTTTWSKLIASNPRIVRNVTQIGDTADDEGWYRNNEYGEKVFELPMTGAMARALTGDNAIGNFTVNLSALNIAGQGLPGVGPVVQFFVNKMAPPTPDYKWLRDFALPFGPMELSANSVISEAFPPSVLQALTPVIDSDTTVGELMRFVVGSQESKDYQRRAVIRSYQHLVNANPDEYIGEAGQARALAEAQSLANKITSIRGIMAFLGPGAPMTNWIAETKFGNVGLAVLLNDLRAKEQEARNNGEPVYKGFERWLNMWGEQVWAYAGSVTKTNIGGLESTRQFQEWASQNGAILERYPLVGGYLGPSGGDFGIDVWSEQLTAGAREINNLEDAARQAQQYFGNYLYYKFLDSIPPSQMNSNRTRVLKANKIVEIEQTMPEWSRPGASGERAREENRNKIDQLRSIAVDPKLQANPVVKGLREYFTAFNEELAAEMAKKPGLTLTNWSTGTKAGRDLRNFLREDLAPWIIDKYPEFKRVWDQVLSYEFVVDEE